MDSVYFALTLLCVMWLVAWYLWGERTRSLWWPFDLRQDRAGDDQSPGPSSVSPPASQPGGGTRPAPAIPWRERAGGRRP